MFVKRVLTVQDHTTILLLFNLDMHSFLFTTVHLRMDSILQMVKHRQNVILRLFNHQDGLLIVLNAMLAPIVQIRVCQLLPHSIVMLILYVKVGTMQKIGKYVEYKVKQHSKVKHIACPVLMAIILKILTLASYALLDLIVTIRSP